MKKKKNVSQIATITTTTITTAVETTEAATTTEELSFTSVSNNNYLKWKLDSSIVVAQGPAEDSYYVSRVRGIYIDDDNQTIYITRHNSNRVIGWKVGEESGETVAGGNGPGDDLNQLQDPSDVTVDKKNDLLIICDQGNDRVVQWSRRNQTDPKVIIGEIKCQGVTIDNNGDIYVSEGKTHSVIRLKQGETEVTTVAGGKGSGYNSNQLNNPAYIFVDDQYSIYVSDYQSGRVTKWIKNAKEGIIIAKERFTDNNQELHYFPFGMAVDHFGNAYVSELLGSRIVGWSEKSKECYVIMNGGSWEQPPYLFAAVGAISLDREGNLYVVDNFFHRIVKFDVDVN
ncbi:unnamed protein product [Adineta steineri]|uniref:Uncharacterized protein n=1 Tax=Adineta steineri TaxID=433720 RepID=A0A815E1H5_9BILA|nr:unnamed protein product [Adineta steineri]CAF1305394.1 unnamed protein product [Adineta steineri]